MSLSITHILLANILINKTQDKTYNLKSLGEVIEIIRYANKAKVKGINIVKKHEKTTKEKKGGIISKENFIHISNLKSLENKDNKKVVSKK